MKRTIEETSIDCVQVAGLMGMPTELAPESAHVDRRIELPYENPTARSQGPPRQFERMGGRLFVEPVENIRKMYEVVFALCTGQGLGHIRLLKDDDRLS